MNVCQVWPALAGLVMAACTGAEPVDSITEAATTCGVIPPRAPDCWRTFCNSETDSWDYTPGPAGEACSGGGTCDGDGNCIPPPPPPGAPANVQITARSRTSLSLSWTAGANARYYYVTTSGQSQFAYGTTATFNALTPGTQYCITVTSVGDGSSAGAPPACARTQPNPFDYLTYDFGGGAYNPGYQWVGVPYLQQPGDNGATLDSLELPASLNDSRLTGFYLYRPSEQGVGSCPAPLHVFLPINGSVSGDALAQVFGSAHPHLRDVNGTSLPLAGCAVFGNSRAQANLQVYVRENYSTP